jgi:penicillin-binding protein 2
MGLGRRTGVDLPSEETGLVPSEDWVQRVFHRRWYPGETISVAIGQGAVTATPLQLAYAIGGIAMSGVYKQPHLLKDGPNVGEERFNISESTVEKVTDAMYGVVNEPHGTAAALKLTGVDFSGKSGTAQIINYDLRSRLGKSKQFKDNSWFVGYAPRRTPEIVVSVLVQAGGHGSEAAGPVVRDVVKAYYDKKTKKTDGTVTAENKEQKPRTVGSAAPAATIQPVLSSPQAAVAAQEAHRGDPR